MRHGCKYCDWHDQPSLQISPRQVLKSLGTHLWIRPMALANKNIQAVQQGLQLRIFLHLSLGNLQATVGNFLFSRRNKTNNVNKRA
jgi:hypothetical protein